jgi:hypothetical protein
VNCRRVGRSSGLGITRAPYTGSRIGLQIQHRDGSFTPPQYRSSVWATFPDSAIPMSGVGDPGGGGDHDGSGVFATKWRYWFKRESAPKEPTTGYYQDGDYFYRYTRGGTIFVVVSPTSVAAREVQEGSAAWKAILTKLAKNELSSVTADSIRALRAQRKATPTPYRGARVTHRTEDIKFPVAPAVPATPAEGWKSTLITWGPPAAAGLVGVTLLALLLGGRRG